MSNIVAIDAIEPDPSVVRQAVEVLRQGGLVVVPTRHLYGLAVDALNQKAVRRVFAIKQRPLQQPLLILIPTREAVAAYARNIDARAQRLMDDFWPGKLTVILEAGPRLPAALTGGSGRIGLRLPAHAVCRDIVASLGRPITATSANLSGQPGVSRVGELHTAILAAADLVLDAGPLIPGVGSTVVDVQAETVRVLREGAVAAAAIREAVGRLAIGP